MSGGTLLILFPKIQSREEGRWHPAAFSMSTARPGGRGVPVGDVMQALPRNCLLLTLFVVLYACGGAGNRTAPSSPPPHHVDLQWSPGSNADITYNAYRSLTPGGPYSPIATSLTGETYSDWTVKSGTTYYYVVTAVDSQGRESPYSGEATATVP